MGHGQAHGGRMTRRGFVTSMAAGVSGMMLGASLRGAEQGKGDRPNILWIVSEDNNPFLGAC